MSSSLLSVLGVLALAAIIAGMWGYTLRRARRDGRELGGTEQKNTSLRGALEDAKAAKDISDRVDNMSAADLERLRGKLNDRP